MSFNLNNQIAFGFLVIFYLIFTPIFLSSSPIQVSISSPDLSTIANIFVAIGTMFLAIVTWKSVRASEKQVEILNDTFLLSEKAFSRQQILDQIKNLLNPISLEITKELSIIKKMDICDNRFRFIGLVKDITKIKCLDLGSANSFVNIKDEPKWNPHQIYLRENNLELLELLKRREGLLTNCKLRFGSMKSEIFKHTEKIEEIVIKKFDIRSYEEEIGWDSYIPVDYVIFHENNLDGGSINEAPVPMHDFLLILNSLMLADILNPINREKFPFEFDINDYYNVIRPEIFSLIEPTKIENFRDEIRKICDELNNTNGLILKNISEVIEKYIKNYHITSGELLTL